MDQKSYVTLPTLFPYLSYRDRAAALEWLTGAFGLTTIVDFRDPDGNVVHAEMSFGKGAIMLGTSIAEQPAESSSSNLAKHGVYDYIAVVDTHYERAHDGRGTNCLSFRRYVMGFTEVPGTRPGRV